jgi:pimeloyl-ACP methyl ester carboxylesterase
MMVDRRTLDVRYEGMASELADQGIAVVAADLRGHGRSRPLAGEGGSWTYDDLVEQDTPALYRFARARWPHLPLFSVGHSLFAHVALAHLARHPDTDPVAGLVLLAANVWMERCEPSRLRWLLKRSIAEASALVTRRVGRLPVRALRLGNADEPRAFWEQFMTSVRDDDWRARDGFSYFAALSSIRRPVLSIAARGDRLLCRPISSARFVAAIPGHEHVTVGRVSTVEAGRARHEPELAFDPKHMDLLVDQRSRPVWHRVGEFILEHAARKRPINGEARP